MIDLTDLAVPASLDRLRALLPPAPARLLEVGCGYGALSAALAAEGWDVTGVEPDEESVAVAQGRGVHVLAGPLDGVDPPGRYDAVLFTRSLHHVADLEDTIARAAALLADDGRLVLEEFGRERLDAAAAAFAYDTVAVLEAAGLAEDHGETAIADPLARWWLERGDAATHPLHTGTAMIDAVSRHGRPGPVVDTEGLWRLITSRLTADRPAVAERIRAIELRRIEAGSLPAVGFVTAVHR